MSITGINGAINYTMGYANNAVKKNTAKSSFENYISNAADSNNTTNISSGHLVTAWYFWRNRFGGVYGRRCMGRRSNQHFNNCI